MYKRKLGDLIEEYKKLGLQGFFNLLLENGNLEVLLRRGIIESRHGITLSSLASSIIDYEVMDPTRRKGIIGALQIPVHVVGPVKYFADKEAKEAYIPFALISEDLNMYIQDACKKLGSTNIVIDRKNNVVTYKGVDSVSVFSYRKLLFSYSIATGVDPIEISHATTYKDGVIELNTTGLTPSPFLFSVNPTIRDIAKVVTGKEEPEFTEYKEKVIDGILILAHALLASPS